LTGETLAQDVSKVKALITKIEKTINIILNIKQKMVTEIMQLE
jgi:hypothetical protein